MIPDSGFGNWAFKSPHTHGVNKIKYGRKIIHISNGFWALLLAFIPRIFALFIILIAFIYVFILSRPKSKFGNIFRFSFTLMARKEDWDKGYLIGPSIYVGMILFCVLFIDYRIAGSIFAILAFGDGFATIIGKKYGKRIIYHSKTLEGSISFFVTAFPTSILIFYLINTYNSPNGYFSFALTVLLPENIVNIPLIIIILIFFITSIILTLVELFLGDFLNDNLLIPISGIFVYYTLFNVTVLLI